MNGRSYRYVGPAELKAAILPGAGGHPVRSGADFDGWVAHQSASDLAEPFTFVIDVHGVLRLAPRRSEHVACAGGHPVLSAGEIAFCRLSTSWTVAEVTNHSTGYCPDPASWPAVAGALSRAGLRHPAGFTHEVVFRRCPTCRELNVVRDHDFTCVFCAAALPEAWNVDPCDG